MVVVGIFILLKLNYEQVVYKFGKFDMTVFYQVL